MSVRKFTAETLPWRKIQRHFFGPTLKNLPPRKNL